MLNGMPTSLHRRAQRRVASWVTMTVMAGEFVEPDHVSITAEERRKFHLNPKTPPLHWKVWIGAHQAMTAAKWTHKAMSFAEQEIEGIQPQDPERTNSQATTILLGHHLVIHVMSSPARPDVIRNWRFPPHIEPHMLQIWPVCDVRVFWPPEESLTDEGVETVADHLYGRSLHYIRKPR